MLCSNLITELPHEARGLDASVEMLSDSRAKMTAHQLTHMDSKEKRVAALFFLEIGASSKQFNPFRRAMDSVSTRSWEEQHLAQGFGTGESRRSAMGNRRALTLTFDEDYQKWLRRNGSDVFMMILVHDDFMQQKKKFQFTLKETGTTNATTGGVGQQGKAYFLEIFAVGVVKILDKVPAVYENPKIPTKNPEFISVDVVVGFVRATLFLGYGDSCQGVLSRFLQGCFTGGSPLDVRLIWDEKSFFRRIENHFYRNNSEATEERNCRDMGLNHLQRGNSFKSFKEFLMSALAFMANPEIFEGCENKRLYCLLGDFPEFDRMTVLLLQGDGTGRRTIAHLAELLSASITPDLKQKFQFLVDDQGQVPYERIAAAMVSGFVPMSGPFHIKINFFTDVVVFWSKLFNKFYAKIAAKKKTSKAAGEVKDMKTRMQICLLEAINAGYILVRDKILPLMESMEHTGNVALSSLRYLFEYASIQAMVFYDVAFKGGKFPTETRQSLAMLLFDCTKTQRHNYPSLLTERLSQELYWKETGHDMFEFTEKHGQLVDEIVVEGGANNIINRLLRDIWDSDDAEKKVMLHWAKKYNLVVEQLNKDFKIQEVKCRNPLHTNIDTLAIIAAEFICESVLACVVDGSMIRSKNRKTRVTTDTVQIPSLFGVFKSDACRVLAPGIALFPDKRQQLTPTRQSSDSSDGFQNPNGCQYRECSAPTVPSALVSMLCSHVVCSNCTSSNGICKKCINKSLTMMTQCGLQKKQSRATKFIDVTQLHLTRLPDDDDAPVAEPTEAADAGSDEERERDSDSDDDTSGDDDDNLGDIEIVQKSSKSRHVQAIQTGFLKNIEQLRLQHAAVPAQVLLPGAVTEHDGDALLPPSLDATAAAEVPPLLPSVITVDVTAAAVLVSPLPQPANITAPVHVPPLPQPMDVTAAAQVKREEHLKQERERAIRNYCKHKKQRSKCTVCRSVTQQHPKRKAADLADSPTM